MKKVYKDSAIRALRDLASYDFQKKAWLASSGPLVSDFEEDVCQLFDDTGLKDALNDSQVVFGKKIDNALRELHTLIHQVNYKNVPPQIILADPHMEVLRKKAAGILKLIASDISSN